MIDTGCGMVTDHFARSGVIGNGDSPIWGVPASLATFDTAMDEGVVDEPMMMSALDSVTKRRALVVALVGWPPSSSTITLRGTPPISLATNACAAWKRRAAVLLGKNSDPACGGKGDRRRRSRRGDGDADGDFIGLRHR